MTTLILICGNNRRVIDEVEHIPRVGDAIRDVVAGKERWCSVIAVSWDIEGREVEILANPPSIWADSLEAETRATLAQSENDRAAALLLRRLREKPRGSGSPLSSGEVFPLRPRERDR